ncbi:MAG: DUF459 domain-containing protein [Alphaproteobacteria bacterium]|nr:DUF459 domain-containing protein [Alphaproteobacteria bacterium]
MAVADKYKPVRTASATLAPAGATWVLALLTAVVVAASSADTMTREATYGEGYSAPAVALLHGLASLGEATGLAPARRWLDELSAPLDDTARWFKKARKPAVPADAKNVSTQPPPEPSVPPGERWAATKDAGRAHRILIVGASSIQYAIGTELERELNESYEDLEVYRKGKVATGLARPDVFDWPKEIDRLVDEFGPDVVIGQFGGNDGQNLVDPEGHPLSVFTEGWEAEYGRRLTEVTRSIAAKGARFVILGMPVMRSDAFTKKIRWLNDVTRRFVEDAGGTYVDITDLSVDADGNYEPSVRFEGTSGRMRMDDGIHFTRLGGQYVAWHLVHKLEREMVLVPRTPEAEGDAAPPPPPAVAHRFDVPSTVRPTTPLLAFVPQDVPTEGLPVWYLLHGAWDDWTAWSTHDHDALQALAAAQRMIIVTPDGEPFGFWLDGTVAPDHRIATWFEQDLVPFVDATLPSNGTRAISGLSMGGHGALTLAMAHSDAYVAATSMSGAVDLTKSTYRQLEDWLGPYAADPAAWEARSTLQLVTAHPERLAHVAVMLTCGRQDKTWWAPNEALHELLLARGIAHTWDPRDGGHTWELWDAALPDHAAFVGEVVHRGEAPPPPPAPRPPDPDKNQPDEAPATP